MANLPYSGALMRRPARYAARPPVPGVNPEHLRPDPDPDPFAPEVEAVSRPGDVWQPQEVTVHTEMRERPVSHWANLQAPVPSAVPSEVAGIATTARMLANHGVVDYRPDTRVPYKHASQGRSIEYVPGRAPWQAGEDVPEGSAYLQAGTNAYDRTNQPTEVYGAGDSNVGRYRLGVEIQAHGLYEFWTFQGHDPQLRAYEPLAPALPVDKPRLGETSPQTPNSRGTETWTPPVAFQVPSLFGLPSETSVTDYATATEAEAAGPVSEFDDGGRL